MQPAEPMGIRFSDESLPAAYDRLFTPTLFEPWGRVLLDVADIRPGEAVSDVATGPGTVARLTAARAGRTGRVAGIDLSGPMLEIARGKPPLPGAAPLEFHRAPADALPFADATFDVVLCQQGLQFFPDRLSALREMRRVLKPGGRVLIAVWARGYARGVDGVLIECLAQATGHQAPLPTFGTQAGDLPAALSEAGFRSVRCEDHSPDLRFPGSLDQVIESMGAGPWRVELVALSAAAAAQFCACVERQLRAFTDGEVLRTRSVSRIGMGSR